MIWLLMIGALVVLVILYLMTAPVVFEVDSERDLYRVRFHRIASAGMRMTGSSLFVDINVFGWKKPIDLFQPGTRTDKTLNAQRQRVRKNVRRRIPFRKVLAIIRSFKINKCRVIIDTGDMPVNGMLFPVCYWVSKASGRKVEVSFTGENVILLEIQNSMARMLSAYVRS